MPVKVAIIYYSPTGTTYHLARAVEQGASETGAEVRLRKVHELAPDEAIAANQGMGRTSTGVTTCEGSDQ